MNCEIAESATERSQMAWSFTSLPQATMSVMVPLWQAYTYSLDVGRDLWDFAVSIAELRSGKATENDLRWLVCRGLVHHAREVSKASSAIREFVPDANLQFSKQTAFVLTESGVRLARELSGDAPRMDGRWLSNLRFVVPVERTTAINPGNGVLKSSPGNVLPKWDRDRRELTLGGQLIKVFKLPSPMQERILMAFDEEGWPPRIDDPLPMHPDLMPKERLHNTIKSLNRNRKSNVIRFLGDGTGEGVRWEHIGGRLLNPVKLTECHGRTQNPIAH